MRATLPLLAGIPIIYVPVEPDQGGQALRQRLAGSAIAERVWVVDLSPIRRQGCLRAALRRPGALP